MIDLFEAAAELQAFCDGRGWQSCFIGGIAVQRWGEPRVTRDIDLCLLAGFGGEADFVDALMQSYPARIPDAREFALRHRVLLLKTQSGVGIDVSLAALPFEERVISQATSYSFRPGPDLRTCSAEDLVVLKLFASRPTDVRDAEGVAVRHGAYMDWVYVEDQLRTLVEATGETDVLRTLVRVRRLAESSD